MDITHAATTQTATPCPTCGALVIVSGGRLLACLGASAADGKGCGAYFASPYYVAPAARRNYGRCRDCHAPGHLDTRGYGIDCGCAR